MTGRKDGGDWVTKETKTTDQPAQTTRRDDFAMAALIGLVSNRPTIDPVVAAQAAFTFADAMMLVRSKA